MIEASFEQGRGRSAAVSGAYQYDTGQRIRMHGLPGPEELARRDEMLSGELVAVQAQFGYEGDETGNVLWRIRQGELDGLRPKNIVLLIGTNNFGHRANEAPEDVFLGIQAIVDELRLRQPQARVVLLPLFPRGKQENAAWRGGRETNKLLPRLCDGRQVVLLDFTAKLLDADGKVAQALLHDFLHPSPAGYALWADELIRFLRGR